MKVAVHRLAVAHRPPWALAHTEPAGRPGFDGAPEVHTSFVQSLPSSGTSVSSTTAGVALPEPSQRMVWQSPATWVAPGAPWGSLKMPQK
jgi:hypothetical protein